jgi:hypothetical protein
VWCEGSAGIARELPTLSLQAEKECPYRVFLESEQAPRYRSLPARRGRVGDCRYTTEPFLGPGH